MEGDGRQDRLLGTVLDGRFRLDRLLGAGGMGKVYAGRQLSVERDVAVKVLREELSESETLTRRFFREAKVVANLRHANIVGLVDFGRDEAQGLLYIAMEYVDGRPLSTLLRRGRLEASLAVSIARQICSALSEAHAAGVVHRDLKPDNVMLVTTAEGALAVKVLDFGIALPSGEEARLTSTGAVVGTPHYMAPEQAQDGAVGAQSDVYALGVMLYEMLTGRLPFVADTPMAVLLKVITQPPPPLADTLATRDMPPAELARLLEDMLRKEVDGRPQTMMDVARRLDQVTATHDLVPPSTATLDELDAVAIPLGSEQFAMGVTLDSPAANTPSAQPAAPDEQRPSASAPMPTQLPKTKNDTGGWIAIAIFGLIMSCCLCSMCSGPSDDAPHRPSAAVEVDFVGIDASLPEANDRVDVTVDVGPMGGDIGAPPEVIEPQRPVNKERVKKAEPQKPRAAAPARDLAAAQANAGTICSTGNCTFNGTVRPGAAVCTGDATCAAECEIGECQQLCQDEATCTFECDAGGCKQFCQDGASCDFRCDGGRCEQRCFGNGSCALRCSGGECIP